MDTAPKALATLDIGDNDADGFAPKEEIGGDKALTSSAAKAKPHGQYGWKTRNAELRLLALHEQNRMVLEGGANGLVPEVL